MKSFINIVASDLLKKYGTNLSEVTVVFPNKRASLFLNEELILQSGNKPVWSPQYMTISELFRSQSELAVADRIKLVCELFKHYAMITQSAETLDDFYGWGEVMLNDFDDLDKNMGDARIIFENTADLHEYDSVDFLTEEQKRSLQRFFKNISDNPDSLLKQNFIKLWNNLGNIYDSYKEALRAQNIAYEGMLYRDVAENIEKAAFPSKVYVFVGFNLLQKAEQQIFEKLARDGKARFYWDFDKYYMENDNEAGRFIKQYYDKFPNEIEDVSVYDNFSTNKDLTYISAASEDIQARYISSWLTKERIDAGKRTAIVMCDEKLLTTAINCLPEEVKDINITTGYPLAQTNIATLVKLIFMLHQTGVSRSKGTLRLHSVNQILKHPYMKYFSEKTAELLMYLNSNSIFYPTTEELGMDEHLSLLFSPYTDMEEKDNKSRCLSILQRILYVTKRIAMVCNNVESSEKKGSRKMQLDLESLYRMHQIATRLATLIEKDELTIDTVTLFGLLNQIIRSTNVPFHGEPIVGIQIMGILETRNLDFEHILILSANEGNMPKSVNDVSFIPHTVRKAYDLTTIDNKVSIFSYYFHRMLQRANDVSITYNNVSSDAKTCEMSRFMMQLLAESDIDIKKKSLTTQLNVSKSSRDEIKKTRMVIDKMNGIEYISPTAISNYMKCQKKFFYKNVCLLDDNMESDEEEIDSRVLGLIFHKTAELLYSPYKGKEIRKDDIDAIMKDPSIVERALSQAFREELFKLKGEENITRKTPALNGEQLIKKEVVRKLIYSLLSYDKECCPIHIIDLEKRVYDSITFPTDNGMRKLMIKGFVDRIDSITDNNGKSLVRVIDYKTGKNEAEATDIASLFKTKTTGDKGAGYYIQTLIYCKALTEPDEGEPMIKDKPIVPGLLYPHKYKNSPDKKYNPILTFSKNHIEDARVYYEEFEKELKGVLCDIFNYNKPFYPVKDKDECKKCGFKSICGKFE